MCGGEEKKEVENYFRVSGLRYYVEMTLSIWTKFPGWAGTKHDPLSGPVMGSPSLRALCQIEWILNGSGALLAMKTRRVGLNRQLAVSPKLICAE